jgi:predicted metal-dependent hydrolase
MQAIWNFTSLKRATATDFEGPVFESNGTPQQLLLVRSPRARRMRLVVDPRSGAVRLTLPKRASLSEAYRWAETKRGWIEGQLSTLPAPQPITPGMTLSVAGHQLTLDWAEAYPRRPKQEEDRLEIGGPVDQLAPRLLRWIKREALEVLAAETLEYARKRDISIGKVGVGDPSSRWGSCAPAGDIRYSWRLILAPDHVRRATVAHEVAHRIHMNHGPAFHALVAELFEGDPSPARRWLRTHGASLHWFGRDG